ncbi:MAG: GFA family protein [Cellvibrionaceae bacterium]
MSQSDIHGSCLCGKVSYKISRDLGIFQYCHCSRCRKFTGSAHATNLLVAPDAFRWLSGEEYVGRYEPEDTRHFATSFCQFCGSSLPWLGKTRRSVVIPAGTLDDDPVTRPQWNIFCDSKADWYTDPKQLPEYDQLPPKKNK